MKQKAILIFDVGKTNKKVFLFSEKLQVLHQDFVAFTEITDEDGFACDDIAAITKWMLATYQQFVSDKRYEITVVNFSAYGASMVHLDEKLQLISPLYNYIKPLPGHVAEKFKLLVNDVEQWSTQTASPWLEMLNAGLQLYWLKNDKPDIFKKLKYSVFLPQYLSFLLSGKLATDYTGIGCHTGMWNFAENSFHEWMYKENLVSLLPSITDSEPVTNKDGIRICNGIHDSSAALYAYLQQYSEPFILLSTGTWSICLNPFNHDRLTASELEEDCLCYLLPDGLPVKASRFFMGNEFSKLKKVLNQHFAVSSDYHSQIKFDASLFERAKRVQSTIFTYNIVFNKNQQSHTITQEELGCFETYEEAYHQLIKELLELQVQKIWLVMTNVNIKTIYVDGGFARNKVFITMLQEMMPGFSVIATEMPLGTALGAAMMAVRKNNYSASGLHREKSPAATVSKNKL